jgi:hypothetical protein
MNRASPRPWKNIRNWVLRSTWSLWTPCRCPRGNVPVVCWPTVIGIGSSIPGGKIEVLFALKNDLERYQKDFVYSKVPLFNPWR